MATSTKAPPRRRQASPAATKPGEVRELSTVEGKKLREREEGGEEEEEEEDDEDLADSRAA